MVISFQLENVRNQLLKQGVVYTFRSKPHKEGKDWAQVRRGTPKIADVMITHEDFSNAIFHINESGFKTFTEWCDAYVKLTKDKHLNKAQLYKVKVLTKD